MGAQFQRHEGVGGVGDVGDMDDRQRVLSPVSPVSRWPGLPWLACIGLARDALSLFLCLYPGSGVPVPVPWCHIAILLHSLPPMSNASTAQCYQQFVHGPDTPGNTDSRTAPVVGPGLRVLSTLRRLCGHPWCLMHVV
jgi:hypothetical protein